MMNKPPVDAERSWDAYYELIEEARNVCDWPRVSYLIGALATTTLVLRGKRRACLPETPTKDEMEARRAEGQEMFFEGFRCARNIILQDAERLAGDDISRWAWLAAVAERAMTVLAENDQLPRCGCGDSPGVLEPALGGADNDFTCWGCASLKPSKDDDDDASQT